MIRVALADDQELVRAGFAALLDAEDDLEVVGEAADGKQAVRIAEQHRPDVMLMDIRMPVLDGIEAIRQIAAKPDLTSVHVVILTTFELDEYVFEGLRAGAAGFLVKDTDAAELIRAVRGGGRRGSAAGPYRHPPPHRRVRLPHPGDAKPSRPERADPAGARSCRPHRPRAVQRGDLKEDLYQPVDGEDPRHQGDDQARRAGPRAVGRLRLPSRPGPPWLVLVRRRLRRRDLQWAPGTQSAGAHGQICDILALIPEALT
jgi:CheY-like chemotaxis protein